VELIQLGKLLALQGGKQTAGHHPAGDRLHQLLVGVDRRHPGGNLELGADLDKILADAILINQGDIFPVQVIHGADIVALGQYKELSGDQGVFDAGEVEVLPPVGRGDQPQAQVDTPGPQTIKDIFE
jgi:hypothetical protein